MKQQGSSKGIFFWLLLGAAVVAGAYLFRGGTSSTFRSYANRRLPSLDSPGQWLNADSPLSWASLTDRVVWLEFSFLH